MKIKFFLSLIILLTIYHPIFAQRKIKLNTNGQGALFAQIGYNRSYYSTSNVELNGTDYSFVLKETSIKDNNSVEKSNHFFSPESPQVSIKLGYFIKPKWALTLSFDRYNTYFENNQRVRLDGVFAPESHSVYSGSVNEDILLNNNALNISQTKGVNFFSVGVQHNDIVFKSKRSEFSIHTLYAFKLGGLFSIVDYTYDSHTTQNVSSLTGLGASAEVGVRFEFYQHIFLQVGLGGGILNQNNIKLSKSTSVTGKQVVGFVSPSVHLGFNVFASSKNNCGTCPQW